MPKSQPLEYQSSEPAFIRRLKAGNAALDGRHNVQIPRVRGGMGKNDRLNMGGDEGEDDPVVLDESGNLVTKEEMKVMEKEVTGHADEKQVDKDEGAAEQQKDHLAKDETSNVSSGFGRKRKAAKVVGSDDTDGRGDGGNEEAEKEPVKSLTESTKDLEGVVGQSKEDAITKITKAAPTKRGKKKKVKLSFDEPE